MSPESNTSARQRRMVVIAFGTLLSCVVMVVAVRFLLYAVAPKLVPLAHLTVQVLAPMTSVKHQGRTQLCWAYSMLAAVETECFLRGDSLNLPIEPVADLLPDEPGMPSSCRAMGQTLFNLMQRHDLYPGVCPPHHFVPLCSMRRCPYGKWMVPDLPDNWEGNSFFNVHPDTLLSLVTQAVTARRGVGWEGDVSEPGFSFPQGMAVTTLPPLLLYVKSLLRPPTDDHCMAIVGLVRDDDGTRYFVMKNSWGSNNPYGGLMLMSLDYFRWNTVALYLPSDLMRHE